MDRVFDRTTAKIAIFLLAGLGVFLSFPKAFADKFNTETSSEAAMLGMGNAGINVSRGPYSVFYNPANIAAKNTGTHVQLVNFQFEASQGLISQLGSANNVNFLGLGSLYPALKSNPDVFAGGRFSLYPNITLRNVSLGLLYEVNQAAAYRASDGALRVRTRNRFSPTAALSYRFFGGILRLGASAQWVTVGNAETALSPPIPGALDYKSFINSLSGFSFAGGTTLTLPFRYLPSFSVVARDIGGTRYGYVPLVKFGDRRKPYTQPMTFDFGSSMLFLLGRRLEMKVALDYRDLTNQLAGGRFRHVFAGSELVIYDALRARVGLQHGYLSYGLGLSTKKASLDFAVYSDETEDRLRGGADTRYVLQYTWELFN